MKLFLERQVEATYCEARRCLTEQRTKQNKQTKNGKYFKPDTEALISISQLW